MKMIKLQCPNCGADLAVENGLDLFYCQYCGAKLLLRDQSDAAYNARIRAKQMEHEERMQDKKYSFEMSKYEKEYEDRQDDKRYERKKAKISIIFVAVVFGICFSYMLIMAALGY